MPIRIQTATVADVPRIVQMIRSLAEYEQMSERVAITEAKLCDALFGDRPLVEAAIAVAEQESIGYVVFFPSFSTFSGNPGLYLEDIFVEDAWRRRGVGRKLLAHVAAVAVSRGCDRVTWSVLNWNQPAMRFYQKAEAAPLSEWMAYGVAGEKLLQLARS